MKYLVHRALEALAQEITQEIVQIVQEDGIEMFVFSPSLATSLAAMPKVKPRRLGKNFLDTCVAVFLDEEPHIWNGVKITLDEAMAMIPFMRQEIGHYRRVVEVILAYIKEDEDNNIRVLCVNWLACMGEAAAQNWVIEELLGWLKQDKDEVLRSYAAVSMEVIGSAAAEYPEVLETLLACLKQPDSAIELRYSAAKALGNMGKAAAEYPGVLETLLACLKHFAFQRGTGITSVLGNLGKAASQNWVLDELLICLKQEESDSLRCEAARTLRWMSEAVAEYPGVLETLLGCLKHNNPKTRDYAAYALGEMGRAAAEYPGVLEALLTHLDHISFSFAPFAAFALGKLGKAAAKDWVIEELLLRLKQEGDAWPCFCAALALGGMGGVAAEYPGFLKALLMWLSKGILVHPIIVDALANLGEAAAQDWVLEVLLVWLKHETMASSLGKTIVIAMLGGMGTAAAEFPGILAELLHYAMSEDTQLNSAAHLAFMKMRASGLRLFENEGEWYWNTVEALAEGAEPNPI